MKVSRVVKVMREGSEDSKAGIPPRHEGLYSDVYDKLWYLKGYYDAGYWSQQEDKHAV